MGCSWNLKLSIQSLVTVATAICWSSHPSVLCQGLNWAVECLPLLCAREGQLLHQVWHFQGAPACVMLNNKLNSCLWTAGSYLGFCGDEKEDRVWIESLGHHTSPSFSLPCPRTLLSLFPPSQSPSYCFASHILWAWKITDVSLKHVW